MPRKKYHRLTYFDRDFPSLSGNGPAPQTNSGWSSNNAIRQPSSQQQLPQPQPPRAPSTAPSHQSLDQLESQFAQQAAAARSSDDFVPLGEQMNALNQSNGFGNSLGSPSDSHTRLNGQQTELPIRESPATFASPQPQEDQSSSYSSSTAPGAKKWADMTEQERYGMAGLAAKLQAKVAFDRGLPVDETMPVKEVNGAGLIVHDLAQLGVDLNSPEPLYKTFHAFPELEGPPSIYDIKKTQPTPFFQLSDSYRVRNVPPVHDRISSYSDDTLFTMFFNHPNDVRQEWAAQELHTRSWRWHKILQKWLQRDTTADAVQPVRLDEHTQRGVYIFFNQDSWQRDRREFTLNINELEDRVMVPPVANYASPFATPT